MFYLIKSVSRKITYGLPEVSMEIVRKSNSKSNLQNDIRFMYEHAQEIWDLDNDDCVNGASLEEIEETKDEVEYFDKDSLSILILFPELGVKHETIDYYIVSDDGAEEI